MWLWSEGTLEGRGHRGCRLKLVCHRGIGCTPAAGEAGGCRVHLDGAPQHAPEDEADDPGGGPQRRHPAAGKAGGGSEAGGGSKAGHSRAGGGSEAGHSLGTAGLAVAARLVVAAMLGTAWAQQGWRWSQGGV